MRITRVLTIVLALALTASGCTAISAADSSEMEPAQTASPETSYASAQLALRLTHLTKFPPGGRQSVWQTKLR
jgi:hypothetical protein